MYMVSFKNELKEAEEAELTTETLFQKVDSWLTKFFPEYAKACEELDYKLPHQNISSPGKLLYGDSYPEPDIRLNTGGSEGIYIDYEILYRVSEFPDAAKYYETCSGSDVSDVIPCRIGTYKMLNEGPDAYRQMGMIVGYLTYATELYFTVNDALIKKQNS